MGKVRKARGTTFVVSKEALAKLGCGKVAYVKEMTAEQLREMYPNIGGVPVRGVLYVLQSADGYPIVVSDERRRSINHALRDDLELASLH
ncbi:MAG TPA: DUF1150 family protein [Candidatus Paceibacterota bacterium]|nr:DUF1150 family protein [Candidatus Paceibacterota bacterium]